MGATRALLARTVPLSTDLARTVPASTALARTGPARTVPARTVPASTAPSRLARASSVIRRVRRAGLAPAQADIRPEQLTRQRVSTPERKPVISRANQARVLVAAPSLTSLPPISQAPVSQAPVSPAPVS